MATMFNKDKARVMIIRVFLIMIFVGLLTSVSFAADVESRLNMLEETLKKTAKNDRGTTTTD
ncbi:MAG: hypothetical protein A4E57_02207 [Syntrophorhabdaceae bacterium PtaU1.Bin034]|jgi:hypothetical protein|nr:MAG: hypothetical protein A4E57_02207 [Syntrophorhabdaceae bacterium PtaU1.Bin034]